MTFTPCRRERGQREDSEQVKLVKLGFPRSMVRKTDAGKIYDLAAKLMKEGANPAEMTA